MKKFIFLILFFLLLLFPANSETTGSNIYLDLHSLYLKWDANEYGSSPYYRKAIWNYLLSSLEKNIETDYCYIATYPHSSDRAEYECKFSIDDWLEIRGNLSNKNAFSMLKKKEITNNNGWRSDEMISISGKIYKFGLTDIGKKKIVLVLYEMTLQPLSEKNKK